MRDFRAIALLSCKGGTGKTTLSLNLAVAAHRRGRRVVLADADPQRSAGLALKTRQSPEPGLVETSAAKLSQLRHTCEREGVELLVIDTAPAPEIDLVAAARIADLCIVITRPTFLDIAQAVRAADIVRRAGGRGLAVLNQAPSAREGREPAVVDKALQALRFVGLPIAPVVLRSRVAYQASIALGLAAEEWAAGGRASDEIGRLWAHVETVLQPAGAACRA